jgi:gamma-glutamyltranspeptidase/glutathione hydrolase
MLARDGNVVGPFGIMGAFIQAQAHAHFVHSVVDHGLDPQAALDAPRFRIDGDRLLLEPALWPRAAELAGTPLELVEEPEVTGFGGGQAIFRQGEVLVGGSDSRKDGYAAGF